MNKMKNSVALLFALVISSITGYAQCTNPFYEFKKGTKIFMQNFDGENQLQGKTETEVKDVTSIVNGFKTTVAIKVYDKDEKLISEGSYGMECDNGIVKLDLSSFIPTKSLMAFGDMKVKIEMEEMEIPAKLYPGQELKDASLTISTVNSPFALSMRVDMLNRKVEKTQTVTTPAGKFECFKLTYDMVIDFMMGSMTMKNVQFITEKLGAVRTETYDDEDKLLNYTILQKVEYGL